MYLAQNRFKKMGPAVFAMGAVLLVSACAEKVTNDPLAGGGGLAGRWVAADNVFTASFENGTFIATANDTGSVLSEGTYIVTSTTQVNLDWQGNVTGARNTATCQRPDPNTLNCTDAAGKTFTLRKQVAAS